MRAAKADVQKSNDALASAEAEIRSRQSALEFAKSDFERGQELMKTGFVTKQVFEQRKRNFDLRWPRCKTSPRSAIRRCRRSRTPAGGRSIEFQSIIDDLTLVSPRLGRVQYQLARAGEVIAAGAPIVTILDLTDVYMTVFLPAADAGKLAVGDEARIILDPVPDYVIPAKVSFVAADAQFHPKDRRDHGRTRQADVPRQAEDRCAGASAILHAGEDGRPGLGLRPHQGRC